MSTAPIDSSTLSTTGTTLAPTNNDTLGQNDFLQLMMDQLENQDPLDPSSDPTEYLSELAQFSQLEESTNIATSEATTAGQSSNAGALALLGHTVSYSSDGSLESGTVSSVQFGSSGPTLTIGAITGVPLSAVTEAS